MKATEAAELAIEILRYLETKRIDGERKIVALKGAASILEHILQLEGDKQILQATLLNAVGEQ